MATNKEVREVFEEAIAIGLANDREKTRHRNATDRLMVRAAENVYAAHQAELVRPDGFSPRNTGGEARAEVRKAAEQGRALTAKGYALLIGFSESYISRLYRLGFGIAAGVLNPEETSKDGPTLWQQVSRQVGDSPEVAAVLGKEVEELPTVEALTEAVEAATERRRVEREQAAALAAEETWMPTAPSEQIGMLEELADVLRGGRHLTPKQVERVSTVMDRLRELIEEWAEAESGKPSGSLPRQREREEVAG